MRIHLVLLFTMILSHMASAELKPSPDLNGAPTNDSFIGYQWPLYNNRQTFVGKVSDVLPFDVLVNPDLTFGWRDFDKTMIRETLVAVMDSGVEKDHVELAGMLEEGLSFVSKIPSDDPFAEDFVGHGTHIIGIMAARIGNGAGIAGLSNRIRILPLKIYDDEEGDELSDEERRIAASRRRPFRERMVAALNAAIDRKVDVINLSLGWPRVANRPEIEALFKKAIDQGIVVVAAAGNDDHEAQIYPCAYQGVICVGSVSVEGKRSAFSNYGGHVDLLAPGQAILSLWPMDVQVDDFGPLGYEINSGTSQAAAFVSASAAILRGIYPMESGADIRARLLKSAKTLPDDEAKNPGVLFGLLNLSDAVNLKNIELTAPVFKGTELVLVNSRTLEFELPLVIETSGHRSPLVQVRAISEGVILGAPRIHPGDGDSELRFSIAGRLNSLDVNHRFEYEVTVDGRKFRHKILLALDVDKLNPLKVVATGLEPTPPGQPRISVINHIMDPSGSRQAGFWQTEEAEDGRLLLKVWRLDGQKWTAKAVKLDSVARAYPYFSVVAHDWNGDGRQDYLFAGINLDNEIHPEPRIITDTHTPPPPHDLDRLSEVRYFILDGDLRVQREFRLEQLDRGHVFYPQAKDVMIGRLNFDGHHLKVPVFWAQSRVPQVDHLRADGNRARQQLMFIEPIETNGAVLARTRSLTSAALDRFLRKTLGVRPETSVELLGVKVQSQSDLVLGQLRIVIFIGQFTKGKTYELLITDLLNPLQAANLRELDNGPLDIKMSAFEEAWDLSSAEIERATSITTLYSQVSGRSLVARGLGFQQQIFGLELNWVAEKFLSVMKTYTRGSDHVSILETTEGFRAQGRWNDRPVDSLVPVYRTSFLPNVVFSQIPVPVVVGKRRQPAMMMDNSHFFSRSVSVYALNDNGQLMASVRNSYWIPVGCSVSPEPLWHDLGFSRVVFMCKRDAQSATEIMILDLN